MTKSIFITGASSGFGLLSLAPLLERGHRLLAGLRGGRERLERAAAEQGSPALQDALGSGRLEAVDLHLEKADSLEEAAKAVESLFDSRLDVLINNAGYGLMGPVELHSEEELRRQMEVNFFGPVFLTQRLLPFLKMAKGRVINMTSIAGLASFPFYGAYCAGKFALEAHTEALYYEMKPFGVQVGLIEPGGFKTKFNSNLTLGERAEDPDSGYHERIQSFKRATEKKGKEVSADPMVVVRLMVRLCESRRVPLRTVVGGDARTMALLKRLLPTRAAAGLIRFFFDRFIFRS